MPNFDSGVTKYVTGVYIVEVGFPVDSKGNEYIACRYCPYLSSNERMCQLNKMPVAFPQRHVGEFCPLKRKEDSEK